MNKCRHGLEYRMHIPDNDLQAINQRPGFVVALKGVHLPKFRQYQHFFHKLQDRCFGGPEIID